jgi:hypothetical protein
VGRWAGGSRPSVPLEGVLAESADEGDDDGGGDDAQGDGGDVDPLEGGAEVFDVLLEVESDFAEFLAGVESLLLELLHFGLLFGGQDEAGGFVVASLALEFGDALLGFLEFGGETDFFLLILLLGEAADFFDLGEGTAGGLAGADLDEVVAAGEVVDGGEDHVAVVGKAIDHAHSGEVLNLDPHFVAEEIDVGEEHDVDWAGALLEHGGGVDHGLAVGVAGGAIGEGGFGGACEAGGESFLVRARDELAEEFAGVPLVAKLRNGDDVGFVGGGEEGDDFERSRRAVDFLDEAAGAEVDGLGLAGDGVFAVHLGGAEAQPDDVGDLLLLASLVVDDAEGEVLVACEEALGDFDAPGGQDAREFADAGVVLLPGRAVGVGFAEGIDEEQEAAALEHELVDGEECAVVQALGVDDHEDVDVAGDFDDCGGVQLADRVELFDFVEHLPLADGLGLAGAEVGAGSAFELERGDVGDDGLLGCGEGGDEAADVVFEEAVFGGVEDRDDFAAVDGVGADEAQEEVLARGEGNAAEAAFDGAVFGVGVGLGVDDVEFDFASRGVAVLLEHFLDALGVGLDVGEALGEFLGVVEGELDGFLRALGDVAGAGGQGELAAFGEVELGGARGAADDDVGGEEGGDGEEDG